MEIIRRALLPGVFLTAVHTEKFKSSCLGANFLLPLRAETASEGALLPMVLRRGCAGHPDMEALSAALDRLYGAILSPWVRKKGETQCVGLVGSFLDDGCAPGGESVLAGAVSLLCAMLLHPAGDGRGFLPEYVEGEKEQLLARIRAQGNDKRLYALRRLTELMCDGENYGVDRMGSEDRALTLSGASLWRLYEELLRGCRLELYYCGSAQPERVEALFRSGLSGLKRQAEGRFPLPPCEVIAHRKGEAPRTFEESMDVSQGKLSLGFRTGGVTGTGEEYPALLLLNAVFGASVTSKLFLHVREKLSLCYYASSQLERFKGMLTVTAGVEFAKREEAQREILAQLEECRRGRITPQELESARQSLLGELSAMEDSQGRMEEYFLSQAVQGASQSPQTLAKELKAVTLDAVIAVANKLELDGAYFLKGKEVCG